MVFEIECQYQKAEHKVGHKVGQPKMPTAGAGGRNVVPTETLFPLGNPQRFSFVLALHKPYLTS